MRALKIRNLTANDLELVETIHKKNCDFPAPDLANQLYCCNKVVEDSDGNVVAIGIVRLTSEALLVMNKECPATAKTRAVKMLVNQMRDEMHNMGMDETHAFIPDEDSKLKRLLIRLFGFVQCYTKPIYLQF